MWFKTSDNWATHPKKLAAVQRVPGVGGLWLDAGTLASAADMAGVITEQSLALAAMTSGIDRAKGTDALVSTGLWHDAKSLRRCGRCADAVKAIPPGRLPTGAMYVHDWLDAQLTKDEARLPIDRLRWNRNKRLNRNRELCERIIERDMGRCRYCGLRVKMEDHRSPRGGTYDHVNPDILDAPDFSRANSMTNTVLACRACNGQKGDRTPEEWAAEGGLPLMPEPDRDSTGTGFRPEPVSTGPSLTGAPARETGRAGTDSTGTGFGVGRVGAAPVLASTNEGPEAA